MSVEENFIESEYGTNAKLTFDSIKGVIDFEGKMVKIKVKNRK